MPVHNADIAAVFTEIAELLEIQGENPFRIRAYRNAARSVGELGRSVTTMIAQGDDLTDIPGVGEDLAAKIREIAATGTCALLARLRRTLPPAITELLQIPGLGPKRVRALHDALDIRTLEQLDRAAREGRIHALPGFGEKTEAHIIESIETHRNKSRRFRLAVAEQYAEPILELNAHPERLDLLDTHCQMAKGEGMLVAIDSDAHSRLEFANLRYGIGQARRGWLEKSDVLNTRALAELRPLLARTHCAAEPT